MHLETKPGAFDPARPVVITALGKTYAGAFGRGRVTALTNLSLSIERGEIFGLLGPNGAGKTTLLKTLLGVIHPTTGSARIFGRPVGNPSCRYRIGFLPENHRFPDFLTATQTMRTYGRLADIDASIVDRRTEHLLEKLGLGEWKSTRLKDYSKGMMQRLGLAQSLLNDPALLFLDEPTDGVDPVGRRQIRDLLIELQKEGKTIFLNSHLLSEVELICTRVGILHKGRMVHLGTVQDLTAATGSYRIRVESPDGTSLAEWLEMRSMQVEPDNRGEEVFTLKSSSLEGLNAWIDRLRGSGFLIRSVDPGGATLEERFIDIIERLNASDSKKTPTEIKRRSDPHSMHPAEDRRPA